LSSNTQQQQEASSAPAEPANARRRRPFQWLAWRNLRGWLLVILVVLLIRWIIFEPFRIPSPSMEPTLQGWNDGIAALLVSDYVAVNKAAYGLRWPLNGVRIPFTDVLLNYADERIFQWDQPGRWDIVVFKGAGEEGAGTTFVKRVVGLPGEWVHIEDGSLFIDGERVEPPPELRDVLHYTSGPSDKSVALFMLQMAAEGIPRDLNVHSPLGRRMAAYLSTLRERIRRLNPAELEADAYQRLLRDAPPELFAVARRLLEAQHERLGSFRYGIRRQEPYARVPAGHYFVLGDNSDQSRDGRAFGWLPSEHILGRVYAIWWPPPRWRDFTGFSETWYGMLFLYGAPTLIVLYLFAATFLIQSCPIGDHPGRRVLVDRRAYGWPAPFTKRRITPGRPPRTGEWVVFRKQPKKDRYALGQITAVPEGEGEGSVNGVVVAPERGESAFAVPREQLVGPVLNLTRPRNRRIPGASERD
jgi:signal peptidase I